MLVLGDWFYLLVVVVQVRLRKVRVQQKAQSFWRLKRPRSAAAQLAEFRSFIQVLRMLASWTCKRNNDNDDDHLSVTLVQLESNGRNETKRRYGVKQQGCNAHPHSAHSAEIKQKKMDMSASHAHTAAASASSTSITSLLLKPFLVVAFALLHIAYQTVLLVREARNAINHATTTRPCPTLTPATFTSLDHLLAAHACAADAVRVPTHLAVVLVDAQPSWIRLYLSRLFSGRTTWSRDHDAWHAFRSEFQSAVMAKHCSDMAAVIHLARISGVQQLSMFTSDPLPVWAVQTVCRALQVEYRTKAVVPQLKQELQETEATAVNSKVSWSRYNQLRKRQTSRISSSDSGSPNTSSPASSDSEATPSLLDDDTLASSYTAEPSEGLLYDATVSIRLGLGSALTATEETTSGLQVTLLSRLDGRQKWATLISDEIRLRSSTYLCSTMLPDITAAAGDWTANRISASTLRKRWIGQRQSLTSQLSVSLLNSQLSAAGYLTEPDLLIVLDSPARVRQLHGFPAWPLRVTDLFYDESRARRRDGGYAGEDFVRALCKLGKMEQRYGR